MSPIPISKTGCPVSWSSLNAALRDVIVEKKRSTNFFPLGFNLSKIVLPKIYTNSFNVPVAYISIKKSIIVLLYLALTKAMFDKS